MALDPDLQNSIQAALQNVDDVSKTILARRDLSDVKPGDDVVTTAMVLEKELNAVLVAKSMTSPMAGSIEKSIAAISPGLGQLHISEAKMSAKTGQLNTSKKVSTEVSTAFSVLLKKTLTSLNTVDALIKLQSPSPSPSPSPSKSAAGDYRKAIIAELGTLKQSQTKVTLKPLTRVG